MRKYAAKLTSTLWVIAPALAFESTNACAIDMPVAGPIGVLLVVWMLAVLIGVLYFGARILAFALQADSIEQKLTYLAGLAAFTLTPVPWRDEYALSVIVWIRTLAGPSDVPAGTEGAVLASVLTCAAAWSILAVAGKFRLFADATNDTQRR